MTSDRISKSWIANADAWTSAVRERRIESRRVATDAAILTAVRDQNPQTVLDLGCGEGWLARALEGIEVTGIDGSPALIEAAKRLGGGEFHAMSYGELPSLERTFDVAVANFSLFEEDIHALLASIPAPTLVVQTAHPSFAAEDGWQVETFASFEGAFREPMPWYFRTLASWTAAFERAGFGLVETREPEHPETGKALSMIYVCRRPV
jgi:SAM-dependent methyltransferase